MTMQEKAIEAITQEQQKLDKSNKCYFVAEDLKELDATAYRQRRYLRHLRRSAILKYRIEGLVLSLFPHHMCAAYKAMKRFVRS